MIGHPLIGKLLRWDSDDGEFYTVSRFTEHLGDHLLLATRLCPRNRLPVEIPPGKVARA
jgi:hypothetical protein